VNELAMYFPTRRVDHGYFQVLIVAETTVAEVLRERSAMRNRFGIGHEFNADTIPHRNAIFHIKEKHRHTDCLISSMRADHLERLAETPCLGTDNGYRTFQHYRSARGRCSCID
jgi:hypothetical protein